MLLFQRIWSVQTIYLALPLILAGSMLVYGVIYAIDSKDAHSINRTGAAIAAVEVLIIVVHYMFSRRSHEVMEERRDEYHVSEVFMVEKLLCIVSGICIGVGEILHGFGDLIIIRVLPEVFRVH